MKQWVTLSITLFVLPYVFAQNAVRARQDEIDNASVASSASLLRSLLIQELQRSGADYETRHIHLVIGFSTGHFATDPLAAKAAHEIALGLVQNLLVQGDKVSVYAWEMGIWRHPGAEHNPWVVPSDRGQDKALARMLFPTTCRENSRGGHDTERTIAEIASTIGAPTNEVILLLANSAHSIASPTEQPIGEDAPQYIEALKHWRRVSLEQTGSSSVQLEYTVIKANGERVVRTIDAVVLLPRHFRAGVLQHGTRSERVGVAVAAPPSSEVSSLQQRWFPTVLLTVFLLVLILMAHRLLLLHRGNQQLVRLVENLSSQFTENQKASDGSVAASQTSVTIQQLIDELREQRLVAIKEKERWQQAAVQMFEAVENVLERPEVDAATKKTYERVYKIFSRVLAPLGFQVIRPSAGDPFDERIHVVESTVEDTTLPNMSVLQCVQWGYSVGGELIRPAKVILAVHPAQPTMEESGAQRAESE
ncbi:MAG: nucleotide exchange factor GrpE [bacterium]|nr:nucleotide exchange factor GrpE [bacterium]